MRTGKYKMAAVLTVVSQVLLALSMLSNYWLLTRQATNLLYVDPRVEVPLQRPQNPSDVAIAPAVPDNRNNITITNSLNVQRVLSGTLAAAAAAVPPESYRANHTIHVMYGMKGGSRTFISDWMISLKSLLHNAPLDANLHIHIVANNAAILSVRTAVRREFALEGSWWRNQITITMYNVEERTERWKALIRKAIRENNRLDYRVTIGGYYRLLAYEVIPPSVGPMVYLDTDLVLLANLNDLWKHVDPEKIIQLALRWPCSGFMILNMAKFDLFWKKLDNLPNISDGGDQSLVTDFIKAYPDDVGDLPKEWDGHLGNGFSQHAHQIMSKREDGVAFLHFQGHRRADETFYDKGLSKHCKFRCNKTESTRRIFKNTWGLADYYVRLNWNWLKYHGRSTIAFGHNGYPLRFEIIDTGTGES